MGRVYRLYKRMHQSKYCFVRKAIHFYLRSVYSCDIMPQTVIGKDAYFAHQGLGVIINQHAVIGDYVKIGAHVVIGGKNRNPTVPRIGNNVEIGVGAILLGDIIIGDNAIIGAGAVVVKSVPSNAIVAGNPARVIRFVNGKGK